MAISLNNAATGTTRTPSFSTVTTSGSVASGAKSVSVGNIGGKNGTWLGSNLAPGASLSFDAQGNDTLGAFAYDPTKDASGATTGTTFLITTIV